MKQHETCCSSVRQHKIGWELSKVAQVAVAETQCLSQYTHVSLQDSMRFIFGHHHHAQPEVFKLQQLLPARFGPADLLDDPSTPLLLQPQRHKLSWHATAAAIMSERQQEAGFSKAAAAAFEAAENVSLESLG